MVAGLQAFAFHSARMSRLVDASLPTAYQGSSKLTYAPNEYEPESQALDRTILPLSHIRFIELLNQLLQCLRIVRVDRIDDFAVLIDDVQFGWSLTTALP